MKVEGGGHYLKAVNDGARTVTKSDQTQPNMTEPNQTLSQSRSLI